MGEIDAYNKRQENSTDIQKYLDLICVQIVYRWLDGINIPSIDDFYTLSQLLALRLTICLQETERLFDRISLTKSISVC